MSSPFKKGVSLAAAALVFTLASVLFIPGRAYPSSIGGAAGSGLFHVDWVIDGDTVVIRGDRGRRGGASVRYIGVDTPEKGEPLYAEARDRNIELVGGKTVRMVFCREEPADRYGRRLAWVYADGRLVNTLLLREGLGRAMIIPPCGLEKARRVRAAEGEARRLGLGVWGGGGPGGAASGGGGLVRLAAAYNGGEEDEEVGEVKEGKGGLIWGKYSRIETIRPSYVYQYIGDYVRVRGKVMSSYRHRSGLDIYFHTGGSRVFTATIFNKFMDRFPPELLEPESYAGRIVTVEGVLRDGFYNIEMFLESPEEITMEQPPGPGRRSPPGSKGVQP